MIEVPCHYRRPFIDRNGVVFPCCFLNRTPQAAIGHISDEDIVSKMENYYIECSCSNVKFRQKIEIDVMETLYIQASLKCHGRCAVCYVEAPHKKEKIEVDYDDAFRFVKLFSPKVLCLEGGEIPIIPKAVEFAKKVKSELPEIKLRMITNGCYRPETSLALSEIFDEVTISFMGFSESIYYAETGLVVAKTRTFARIMHEKGVLIRFRFICTPMTLSDIGNFLEWATTMKGVLIFIDDCQSRTFMDLSNHESYWNDTVGRCRSMFIKSVSNLKQRMEDNNVQIVIHPKARDILNFDQKTRDALKFEKIVIFG